MEQAFKALKNTISEGSLVTSPICKTHHPFPGAWDQEQQRLKGPCLASRPLLMSRLERDQATRSQRFIPRPAAQTMNPACWLFPSCILTPPKVFAGHGAALCLIIIPCVGILTLQRIKALIYLVEKTLAATEEKPCPNKCSCYV